VTATGAAVGAVDDPRGGTALLPTAAAGATWTALRGLARPHRLLAVAAFTALLAGTGAGLLVPPILGHIVDLVLDQHGPGSITAPVVLLVVVAVGQSVFTGLGELWVARLGETMLATLRERVVRRALGLSLEQVERAGSGDLVARVSGDVSVIAAAVRSAVPALAAAGLTVGLTVVGLGVLDWRFALAGLLATPIQLYTLRWYLTRSTPVFAAERIAEGARTQQLLDSIGGSETVRAFRLTDRHVDAVRGRSQHALDYALTANRLATRFFGRLNLAEFVGLAAILAVGYWLVGDGAVTVGAAAAAALYFHRLFDPINTLLGLFGTAQEAAAGLARLVGVAETPEPRPVANSREPRDAAIRLESVHFGYLPDHPVLHGIDLTIADGEHVALVGTSGAGKTTIAKLVAGIHPATRGVITLGGVPVAEIPPDQLRRTVALVTQEVHVFAGTVADDLLLAKPTASEDELHTALELVDALGWVEALPEGLRTVVGEGGYPLSATQAQQLALARLALADPRLVVLDEATADAGSAGARLLDRAATRVLDGRTALVVAHRLSQAAAADRIVVIEDGRVVEQGSQAALVAAGGTYSTLWQAWSGARADGGATAAVR